MKNNHLNLTVTDVVEAKHFLETYFGLKCYTSAGKAFAAMLDDDGFLLNLMHGKDVNYPETFHVGFPQENKEKIDELNQRLKDDGFQVETPAIVHGSYTFYLQTPGGFTLEAYCLIEGEDPRTGPRPSFGKN
ncbi:VOC family protein [Paenibacillus sp. RC67]|uniref:VOC family protein n=1 Tax=Paenibacillus sp. RC67 TaxID=3039392 RepID=UPI0024AD072D|nr:VOC family protein [Paenibacillus sp. RC67]